MVKLEQITEKINQIFSKNFLDELATTSGFIKRRRKLCPKSFFESMLSQRFSTTGGNLEGLKAELEERNCYISKAGINKKLLNNSVLLFFKSIFSYCLLYSLSISNKKPMVNGLIKKIIVVDSSKICVDRKLKGIYGKTRNQDTGFKAQTIMEISCNNIVQVDIKNLNEPDQDYKEHIKHIDNESLLISDLGYFCLDSFQSVCSKDGYFLSRYFKNAKVYDQKNNKEIKLKKILSKKGHLEQIEIPVLLGSNRIKCRLVALKLDEESYSKRLENLLEKRRQDPRLKEPCDDILNRWNIFVTNLPENITPGEIYSLYRLRWQIEIFFKSIKSFLKLRKIDSVNKIKCEISFYLSMILAVIINMLIQSIPLKNKKNSKVKSINRMSKISILKCYRIAANNVVKFIDRMKYDFNKAISFLINLLINYIHKEVRRKRPGTMAILRHETS